MDADTSRALLSRAIARVANRDPDALKYVYRHTAAKLLGVVLRILNDREEAQDVLQDVYLTVWNKADRFDPEKASPVTWLVSLARNRAIDRLRSRGTHVMTGVEEAEGVADSAPLASARVEADEERRRLEACLDQLDPKYAAAVRRAFFDGLTYDALARTIGVPLGTMKSWIRRSLISLRGCLEA